MDNYTWDYKKIMIAEDEETNYLFIEAILEETRVNLIWAKNGKEAFDKFRENPDISLILMDIKMPEMDGLTATKKIRQINTTVPIIAQTAYAMSEDRNKCINAGCTDYLTKPINHSQLLVIIEKYFSKS